MSNKNWLAAVLLSLALTASAQVNNPGGGGGGAVNSVAGKTGTVTLVCGDLTNASPSCSTDATLVANVVGAEATAHKNTASGYAGLDGSSHLSSSQMPALTGDTQSSAGSTATTTKQAHWTTTSVNNAASPYTVASTDTVITCDATAGAVVINLPAASGSGRQITVKKIDSTSNSCTPTRNGTDTIDGATTVSVTFQYAVSSVVDTSSGKWSSLLGILSATPSGGQGGSWLAPEGTDPGTEAPGFDVLWASSSSHCWMGSFNNGASSCLPLLNTANTAGSSFTLDASAGAVNALKPPAAAGAAPTTLGAIAYDTTNKQIQCGNGSATTNCIRYIVSGTGTGATIPASTTQFMTLGSFAPTASEANREIGFPFSGTITSVCITTTTAQPSTGTLVFTLRKGSVSGGVFTAMANTALTFTVAASDPPEVKCDTAHPISFGSGDLFSVQAVEGVTNSSAAIASITAIIQ
jgi:hypothetical protein